MIQLRGVSKTVMSGGQPLTILHPLDLDVADGRCLAIIGPSGSGKSTLLGLIAGLDSASSGTITIGGTDITKLDEDRLARLRGEKIGFVFQFFHLVPSLTAIENIQVPMEIAGRRDAAERASLAGYEVSVWWESYAHNAASGSQAYDRILADADSCPELGNPQYTDVGVGKAGDVFVVLLAAN